MGFHKKNTISSLYQSDFLENSPKALGQLGEGGE